MRLYGSIHTSLWFDANFNQLSDQARLLMVYLLSCPHGNLLGCFRLPPGFVCEDLKWELEKVTTTFQELIETHFVKFDIRTNWILILPFLKSNPIVNVNQGRCVEKLCHQMPTDFILLIDLIDILRSFEKYLPVDFFERWPYPSHTLSDGYRNKNKNKNQNKNLYMSGKPDIHLLEISHVEKKQEETDIADIREDALSLLAFLNEKTGRNYRPVKANLKLIVARLESGVSVTQCRQVIAKKTREWQDDIKMAEYLRPATLFNATKFEQYLGELIPVDLERDDS